MELLTYPALISLFQILMINIVLSGDNAVVIGMVAARVSLKDRHRVIMWGMAAAVILRIVLSLIAVDLLQIVGLTLAGGILLLWVSWRLYRDIRESHSEKKGVQAMVADRHQEGKTPAPPAHAITLGTAIKQIAIADLSMSVDNVLAIAGAANDNYTVLIIGLVVSIALMGIAATFIAKMLERYPALAYVGLVLIVYVAGEMLWEGASDVPEIMEFFERQF